MFTADWRTKCRGKLDGWARPFGFCFSFPVSMWVARPRVLGESGYRVADIMRFACPRKSGAFPDLSRTDHGVRRGGRQDEGQRLPASAASFPPSPRTRGRGTRICGGLGKVKSPGHSACTRSRENAVVHDPPYRRRQRCASIRSLTSYEDSG